jgi:DNA-binding transcriptional regulator YdaS (Cro superfamily)
VYLHQLAARQDGREPSPELCVVIERESGFKVRRQDLRPDDWRRIWPELAQPAGQEVGNV